MLILMRDSLTSKLLEQAIKIIDRESRITFLCLPFVPATSALQLGIDAAEELLGLQRLSAQDVGMLLAHQGEDLPVSTSMVISFHALLCTHAAGRLPQY